MNATPLVLPALGDDATTSGEIVSLSAVGSSVSRGDIYMEVETDKVVIEVPADFDGVIAALTVSVGDSVAGGDTVGEFKAVAGDATEAKTPAKTFENPSEKRDSTPPSAPPSPIVKEVESIVSAVPPSAKISAAGPAARRLARTLGIEISEIQGTGARNRITKQDVTAHAKNLISRTRSATTARAATRKLPDVSQFGPTSTARLSGIAKATSRNMRFSWSEIPHAWVQEEIDITVLEALRKEVKYRSSEPLPLTVTAILCKAVALALHKYPNFNAVLDMENDQLVLRDYINIGVAVDTPRGLVVPAIRDADRMNAIEVGRQLKELSERAVASKLSEKDFQGTGFTISNLGGIGVSGIFPIVNWPEVAILGVASSRQQCFLHDGQVSTRLMMPLTLGFDHRVINGADSARFLGYLRRTLEQPTTILIED